MTNKEKLKKEVNEAWAKLEECYNVWGEKDPHTDVARARWYGLDRAWHIMFDGEVY